MDENDMPRILRDYAADLRIIRGRSEKTIEQYCTDLSLFMRWKTARDGGLPTLGDEFEKLDITGFGLEQIKTVDRMTLLEFLSYAGNDRRNAAKARARKLSAIKSFYKYLTVNTKLLDFNPAFDIDSPTVHAALPKFLTLDESLKLLETIASDADSPTRERDYAIVTLFLNCGMRLSELVGISLRDIDSSLTTLRVLGKGAKERMIYLNDACRDAVNAYLPVRASDPEIRDKDALFLSSRHKRISNKTVQWMVYKYLDAAGLGNRKLSTHKLRHTAATLMYRTGKVDVRVLKDILGHEQLNTTQIYTHVSDEQMERAMNQNPLSELKPKRRTVMKAVRDSAEDGEKENPEITTETEAENEKDDK